MARLRMRCRAREQLAVSREEVRLEGQGAVAVCLVSVPSFTRSCREPFAESLD